MANKHFLPSHLFSFNSRDEPQAAIVNQLYRDYPAHTCLTKETKTESEVETYDVLSLKNIIDQEWLNDIEGLHLAKEFFDRKPALSQMALMKSFVYLLRKAEPTNYYNHDEVKLKLIDKLDLENRAMLLRWLIVEQKDVEAIWLYRDYVKSSASHDDCFKMLIFVLLYHPKLFVDFVCIHRRFLNATAFKTDENTNLTLFNLVCAVSKSQDLIPFLKLLYLKELPCLLKNKKKHIRCFSCDAFQRHTWMILLQNTHLDNDTLISALQLIEEKEGLSETGYAKLNVASHVDRQLANVTHYLSWKHFSIDVYEFFAKRQLIRHRVDRFGRYPLGYWLNFKQTCLANVEDEKKLLEMFMPDKREQETAEFKEDIPQKLLSFACQSATHYNCAAPSWFLEYILQKKYVSLEMTEKNEISPNFKVLDKCFLRKNYFYVWEADAVSKDVLKEDMKKAQIFAAHRCFRAGEPKRCHYITEQTHQILRWLWASEGITQSSNSVAFKFVESETRPFHTSVYFDHKFRYHKEIPKTVQTTAAYQLWQWYRVFHRNDTEEGQPLTLEMICMKTIHLHLGKTNNVNLVWCVHQLPLPWLLKKFLCFDLDVQFMNEQAVPAPDVMTDKMFQVIS